MIQNNALKVQWMTVDFMSILIEAIIFLINYILKETEPNWLTARDSLSVCCAYPASDEWDG